MTPMYGYTFKVSHEEAEAIDAAARERGFTRSDYIRQCLLKLQRDSRESPQDVRRAEILQCCSTT